MSDDGWCTSTEGDLDPDLTEEAGYGGWDAPRRPWFGPLFMRIFGAVALAAMSLGVVRFLF